MDRKKLKKKIKGKLGFRNTRKKQEKLVNLLLSTPCSCDSDPTQCDRHWIIDHPDFKDFKIEKRMKDPVTIAKFLAADYTDLNILKKRKNVCDLPTTGKYIIFSDIHQGAFAWSWDQEDFFWKNKEMYAHMLNYYYQKNYTLIENGDIEEFWLKRWKKSFAEHWAFQQEHFAALYEIRRKFLAENRYIKLHGNHDNIWLQKDRIKKYLWEDVQLDQLHIYAFVVFGNDFLLMHGHQVDARNRDCCSKKGLWWTKLGAILEFFTDTKLYGRIKPDEGWEHHPEARKIHERDMEHDIYGKAELNISYALLAKLMKVYLINSHNHSPKCLPEGDHTFNTGCGVFEGIVYGIELNFDDDVIRVVDWNDDAGMPNEPLILCEKRISDLRKEL